MQRQNNHHVLFIIEGYNAAKKGLLDEADEDVINAIKLAKKYNVQVADTISSFNPTHLCVSLAQTDEDGQKVMILCVLSIFLKTTPDLKKMYDTIIKPAYDKLLEEENIQAIPEWVSHLQHTNYEEFGKSVLQNSCKNDAQLLSDSMEFITKRLIENSNYISREETIDLLKEHPEITSLYALVGTFHIDFLLDENLANKHLSAENYIHSTLLVDNRSINVHVIGSEHGSLTGFKQMESLFKKEFLPKLGNHTTVYNDKLPQEHDKQEQNNGNKSICVLI